MVRRGILAGALLLAAACGSPHAVSPEEAEGVVAKLGSSDTAEESLKMSDPDVSWRPLLQLFADPKSTPAQRPATIRVVMAKANYRRPLPAPIAQAMVSDPDPAVRRAALRAV